MSVLYKGIMLGGLCLFLASSLLGQKRSSAKVGINSVGAPIPNPILDGKKAFVSYEIGDLTAFPAVYSGGPERAYSEFYSQMKQWGRYDFISDPKDADIILAIRFVDHPGIAPQIRLGVSDSRGRVSLWGFVEQINFGFRKKSRDADFTDAITQLVTDLKNLIALSAPTQP